MNKTSISALGNKISFYLIAFLQELWFSRQQEGQHWHSYLAV